MKNNPGREDLVYLDHILECLSAIFEYTEEGETGFLNDRKTQKAVLRELQELAESSQHLSSEIKERRPEIPWEDISGFRNVLVHDYLGLSLPRIWTIIDRDLPPLKKAIESLLREPSGT